jgi:energy-coupling factor transport system ATP-binding protein
MSIVVQNLSHVYMEGSPYEKTALCNINLKIDAGEFVGIIGHTGSGKSTLVQHFNGLLKPSSGKVYINGMDTSAKNLKELRKHVGMVFQYPEHQLFEETVYKDISFGLIKQGIMPEEIENRIRETIGLVGLEEYILQKSPFELSGGQKRRVAISGILVMNPKILILDEPTAGLDPKGRDEIFKIISDYRRESGATVILISHSMEEVARLVERIIVMNNGSIEMDGLPEDIFKNSEALESMGLTVPQITYLLKKLKKYVPEINDNIFTVKEAKEEILKIRKIKRNKV